MEFLSDVLNIELFKCDVHGGFTAELIIDFMRKPIEAAKNTKFMIWVFLDEVTAFLMLRDFHTSYHDCKIILP